MDRREFLYLSTSAATLASGGFLPLLAARKRPKKHSGKFGPASGPRNIFTEPPAIEPVTGYLPKFTPVKIGSMTGDFTATYTLVQTSGAGAKSRCKLSGSLAVSFSGRTCSSKETRENRPANVVTNQILCAGDLNRARKWTLKSSVAGETALTFSENGSCDGSTMTVKAKSWTQTRPVFNPLIAQWALLPLLASGRIKGKPLTFDMLDNSTLRAGQTLRHTGQVDVPAAGGTVKLHCYAQTGCGVLPIHYLVDGGGRVQLITQEAVNWALMKLG